MARRRILVIMTDLDAGGAQRVVLTLLRGLSRDRFEPHLAVVRRRGAFAGDVPEDVPVHDLAAPRVRAAARPLVRLVRSLRPEVAFSTLYPMNLALLLLRPLLPKGTRIVVREGTIPSAAIARRRLPRLYTALVRNVYRSADRVICQSQYMRDELHERFGVPLERMVVIYNPLDVAALRDRAREGTDPFARAGPGPHLVAAGRLSPEKGFDRLIRALPALLATRPDAELWILGRDESPGGGYGDELRAIARACGVEARVHFPGHQANPYPWLAHADLFVLSSHYEGLPNVLLEALACGSSVVALRHPGGTREVLEQTGRTDRFVEALDWREAWFGAPTEPADLSAFAADAMVRAYEEILAE